MANFRFRNLPKGEIMIFDFVHLPQKKPFHQKKPESIAPPDFHTKQKLL